MSEAEKYKKCGKLLTEDAKGVLNAYKNIIKWKDGCKVLDLGCGMGDITTNLLLPTLPKSTKLIVGVDRIPELVDHANRNNVLGSNVTFRMGDIFDHAFLEDLRDFDYVVSFDYLHHFADHKYFDNKQFDYLPITFRALLMNVKKVLKPYGEIFFHFCAANSLFNIYKSMSCDEKWKRYLKNFDTHCSPYENSIDIQKDIENLFKHLGFQVYTCTVREKVYKIPLLEAIQIAISRCALSIPDQLKNDFVKDFLFYISKLNYRELDDNDVEYVVFCCQIAVVYGKKTVEES
ncbi:hypothetical protein RI129_008126 [Pyrocoelia pectoralis]|uniref:Methyltransferase domain-containing protein n=1 Tax=Pyrocoelia pectoralis TaxID=417401 RepID=A0AAN7VFQ1_9COLE